MKRLFCLIVFIFLLLMISGAFANQKVLRGTWNYTIEGSGVYNEGSGESEVSLHETGTLVIKSKDGPEGEELSEFSISGNGTVTFEGGASIVELDYHRKVVGEKIDDVTIPYKGVWPGELRVDIEFEESGEEKAHTLLMKFEISQKDENTISGEVDCFFVDGDDDGDDDDKIHGEFKMTATRVEEGGGGCNAGFSPLLALALLPMVFMKR